MTDKKATHTAMTMKPEGRRGMGRMVEIGEGWLPPGDHIVQLDRLPLGGFSGWVHFVEKPKKPQTED